MNKLEKYVHDNKNLFDEEPTSGHFERLQQKMNRKSGQIVALQWGFSIAATIAIVFLTGIILQHSGNKDCTMASCENAADMKLCYLEKMNDIAGKIELLTKDFDPWYRQEVMTDVQSIIDIADIGLENEIPEELPENQAKVILSNYYRQNLESLQMIKEEIMNYEL